MCAHSEGFKKKVPRSGLGIMGRLTPLKMLLNTIRPFRMSRWRGKAVISRTDRAGAPTAASLGMVIKTPCQESGVSAKPSVLVVLRVIVVVSRAFLAGRQRRNPNRCVGRREPPF